MSENHTEIDTDLLLRQISEKVALKLDYQRLIAAHRGAMTQFKNANARLKVIKQRLDAMRASATFAVDIAEVQRIQIEQYNYERNVEQHAAKIASLNQQTQEVLDELENYTHIDSASIEQIRQEAKRLDTPIIDPISLTYQEVHAALCKCRAKLELKSELDSRMTYIQSNLASSSRNLDDTNNLIVQITDAIAQKKSRKKTKNIFSAKSKAQLHTELFKLESGQKALVADIQTLAEAYEETAAQLSLFETVETDYEALLRVKRVKSVAYSKAAATMMGKHPANLIHLLHN